MNILNWNLDKREFQTIEITQIQFVQGRTDLSDSKEKLRLLVLSHQISQFGIPAFFLESSPKYVKENFTSNPFVIVFDFDQKFPNFSLPSFFIATSFNIDFETAFMNEMSDHIQRALILFYYYKFYQFSPIYHSSFLLFSRTESWCDPFILQPVPTKIKGKLHIRQLILKDLEIQVDSQNFLEEQSIILISPFEHPFLVISSKETQITVQYIDKSIHTFSRNDIKISRVLKPSPSLLDSFQDLKTIESFISPTSDDFNQITKGNSSSFSVSEKDINDFFQKKIDLNNQKEMEELQIQSSELKDLPASIDVILTEQILDTKLRSQISDTLKPLCLFPSKKQDLKLSITPYDTFFERNYGIPKFSIPQMSKSIYSKTSIKFIKIEIPNVIVVKKGQLFEVSAKDVIKYWIQDNLKPISGPKNAHFIVFADSILKENHTKQFFQHLIHAYSLMGFGELRPYPKIPAFCFSNPEDIKSNVSSFFQSNQLLEFTMFPTIIFVIAKRNYIKFIQPNILTMFINPCDVKINNFDFFKSLAFITYSRIRISSTNPYLEDDNLLNNSQSFKPQDIFFKFRYQPPFLLQRSNENVLIIHVCWDPNSSISVWTDDTGSTLHVAKMKNLLSITTAFEELKKIFNDIKVIISIGILIQNISPMLIEPIKHMFNVNVYAISPAPFVQIEYSFKTDEDCIIFTEYEQTSNRSEVAMKPLICCYVASKRFPAYFLSLYFTNNANYQETLEGIASNLSNLSWLSVKPGFEKRTIGYPPGLNLLLQKIPSSSWVANKFEFFPYHDHF